MFTLSKVMWYKTYDFFTLSFAKFLFKVYFAIRFSGKPKLNVIKILILILDLSYFIKNVRDANKAIFNTLSLNKIME